MAGQRVIAMCSESAVAEMRSQQSGSTPIHDMTRPLIVAVAHGLDLVTFLLALRAFGGVHGEANGLMRTLYLEVGPAGIVALKSAGASALAFMSQLRGWALVPAACAGILGAAVNLLALRLS
jgi:hypothetical protein